MKSNLAAIGHWPNFRRPPPPPSHGARRGRVEQQEVAVFHLLGLRCPLRAGGHRHHHVLTALTARRSSAWLHDRKKCSTGCGVMKIPHGFNQKVRLSTSNPIATKAWRQTPQGIRSKPSQSVPARSRSAASHAARKWTGLAHKPGLFEVLVRPLHGSFPPASGKSQGEFLTYGTASKGYSSCIPRLFIQVLGKTRISISHVDKQSDALQARPFEKAKRMGPRFTIIRRHSRKTLQNQRGRDFRALSFQYSSMLRVARAVSNLGPWLAFNDGSRPPPAEWRAVVIACQCCVALDAIG